MCQRRFLSYSSFRPPFSSRPALPVCLSRPLLVSASQCCFLCPHSSAHLRRLCLCLCLCLYLRLAAVDPHCLEQHLVQHRMHAEQHKLDLQHMQTALHWLPGAHHPHPMCAFSVLYGMGIAAARRSEPAAIYHDMPHAHGAPSHGHCLTVTVCWTSTAGDWTHQRRKVYLYHDIINAWHNFHGQTKITHRSSATRTWNWRLETTYNI